MKDDSCKSSRLYYYSFTNLLRVIIGSGKPFDQKEKAKNVVLTNHYLQGRML